MKLFANLKRATAVLEKYPGAWAICGGVAACVYRDTPRFTGDLDIAVVDHPLAPAREIALAVTTALGYSPIVGFVTDQHGKLLEQQALIVGRESGEGLYVGIDFLLPVLPWVEGAVVRAQANLLDYGFAEIPTITPEDLIVAKLYAYQGNPERPFDLDDVRSILRNQKTLDSLFIVKLATDFDITIPEGISSTLEEFSRG
jgi:hypothetical protein